MKGVKCMEEEEEHKLERKESTDMEKSEEQ